MSNLSKPQPGYEYWDNYPDYPVEDWQCEVANDDTRQSYWQWVREQIELANTTIE